MRRLVVALLVVGAMVVGSGSYAWACGSLVSPNGAVDLVRTTTLAAYHGGVEHYVTSFQFASPTQSFGSIIPLPAAPSKVERGGDWTLQRLEREVAPPRVAFSGPLEAAASGVKVLQQVRIDALDVSVLRGGGRAVAAWARQQGFALTKDTPTVLDFYSRRSPYFLAAKYDGSAAIARGLRRGDGIPVHLTIPIDRPWVPLRILGAGKPADEVVNADVFLLTDHKPDVLAGPALRTQRSAAASPTLLHDLRTDRGMSWVPATMWLTALQVDGPAGHLGYDLAVGAHGRPALLRDTGVSQLAALGGPVSGSPSSAGWLAAGLVAALGGLALGSLVVRRRSSLVVRRRSTLAPTGRIPNPDGR